MLAQNFIQQRIALYFKVLNVIGTKKFNFGVLKSCNFCRGMRSPTLDAVYFYLSFRVSVWPVVVSFICFVNSRDVNFSLI